MGDVDFCVVGAGFAGLAAALRLQQAGHSLVVLEARDRLGGRTFTEQRDDGLYIDHGGTWVGPGQDRIYAVMNEFGIPTYKQFTDGEAMMVVDGKQYRYGGTIPWTMSPWASGNLGMAFLELQNMAKSVPLETPWTAAKAHKWDQMTLAQWLDHHLASKPARHLLEMALSGSYTSAASEISMLFVAYQLASAGGPQFVLGVENAAEDSRPVGGMGAIYRAMAAKVADDIHFEQPVRSITQDAGGVTVRSDSMSVRAKRVIVTVPLSIASQIVYEPMLPFDRSFLHQRVPSGAIIKSHAIYDEPFWRNDGLTGQTAAPETAASVTIDACSHNQQPGVLAIINEGPHARRLSKMSAAERRDAALDAIAKRLGPKAKSPIDYTEQNWTTERYSGGAMMAHTPPGVMTEFWYTVRQPCDRIHWAGTETSTVMCGFIDGAVRSGERAARDVMSREGHVIAGGGQLAGAPG